MTPIKLANVVKNVLKHNLDSFQAVSMTLGFLVWWVFGRHPRMYISIKVPVIRDISDHGKYALSYDHNQLWYR